MSVPAPVRLAAMLGAWAIVSFALTRSAFVQAAVLLPFAEWQAAIASRWLGMDALPIVMVPDCSGLDVMALCAGAIALYPAPLLRKIAGLGGALAWLLLLNIARIATLSRAAGHPQFSVLHEYVWPAALTLAAAAYVGVWIWQTERPRMLPSGRSTRFAVYASLFLIGYLVIVAILAGAGALDIYAAAAAGMAAGLLQAAGVGAAVHGRVLQVHETAYLITYECVTTPLLPLYLAAVAVAPWQRRARAIAAAAALPIFVALSVVRLMSLAIPPVLFGSRLFLTHGFNQLLLGALAIGLAAIAANDAGGWRAALRRAAWGAALAVAVGGTAGLLYTRALADMFPAVMRDPSDVQGALPILPSFQLALFASFAFVLWRRAPSRLWIAAAGVLVLTHLVVLAYAPAANPYVSPDARALVWRAWAIAIPAGAALILYRRVARADAGRVTTVASR